jgi:hypothetical protein
MNGTTHPSRPMNRLMKWPVLCGLLALLLAQTAPGQQDFYINNSVVTDPGNIDATNFVNNNSFSVDYSFIYETTDTRNYTNNAAMSSTGIGAANGIGSGFLFDTLSSGSGTRSMASSFYNPGTITCDSLFETITVGTNPPVYYSFPGSLIVNATNLVNPGTLSVGQNGLIQLTGQALDLAYGTLTVEQASLFGTPFGVTGTGNFGTDTNGDWDPSVALTATNAITSKPAGNVFTASPSLPYFNTVAATPSNNIIRAVFIENSNTNVPYTVYFNSADVGLGGGAATIQWVGTFVNPSTGIVSTNYLYLNDDYVLGASTNVTLINGIPSNFTITVGGPNTSLPTATATSLSGFPYPSGVLTNVYSYADIQLIPTSVATGPTVTNPSGALTNLPARTEITANQELNLAEANINGQNYLSLTCTNQFDGAAGAAIVSPYSDINLGVTNGFITVSNLVQSIIPTWIGTIQAWSTEFFYTDTNSGTAVTNDYRVLIVSSSIVPYDNFPLVQNLTLHGTNLVISDELNILNNLSIDAQSLTLTANGAGAGSPYGELNLENENILFASSLPNLLWLTNNGAITMGNAGIFGGPSPDNYQTFINNGYISDEGSTIYASYFENGDGGDIENGSGSFLLQSQNTLLTNCFINADGDISITTGSLVASGVEMDAGRSLTLQVTNLLTDGGADNGNSWSVGGSSLVGLNLPIKPAAGDLLGTSISETASASKNVVNTWAGQDRGISNSGYLNNAAVGQLILSAVSVPPHSLFTFNGLGLTGVTNAIYVDELVLSNNAATFNTASSNVTSLAINPGMVIYYAQALSNGVSVASMINGWNNNQLRWVSTYLGQFSSTNIVVQPLSSGVSDGFKYTVSGVQLPSGLATGANYKVIIQTATNLVSPDWVNVYTGTPPFTYTSFSYTNNQQQFYRAKQGW